MRLAIIGVGRWGKNLLNAFNKQAEVAAVCYQNSSETDQWMKKNHPATAKKSLDEILADASISAVVIATPPVVHKEIAVKALEAGKDVFIEKPVGLTAAETVAVNEAAKANKRILMSGYIYLYNPAWKKMTELLAQRDEKPKYLAMQWFKWGSFITPIEQNLLCHDIAYAISAFPNVTACRVVHSQGHVSKSDELFTTMSSGSATIATSYINRFSDVKKKLVTVVGNKGSRFIIEDERLYEYKDGTLASVAEEKETALDRECKVFLEALKTRKAPATDGAFAVRVRELLDLLT